MTRGCCHGPSDVQHGAACGESWRRGPVECGAIPAHADAATTTRRTWARTPSGDGRFVSMGQYPSAYVADRVVERRRAVALARHYREFEGLSITQIADRLGRSPATVKAYFYDPSDANKGPSREREAEPGGRELRSHLPAAAPRGDVLPRRTFFCAWAGCPAPPVGLGFSCSTGSRNGAARRNSPATTATRRVCRSRRSLVGWDAQTQPSRRISTIRPAIRHARSRRATGECVAAAGRPQRPGTARATPTRIANAAIPARLRRNGHGNGFAKRCALGERATALRRPRMTGRARTHAGAGAKRSNDYRPENGPRRPLSAICTGAGRRPSPTPSAAPERSGVNAVDIRTRAGARPLVNGSGERSPRRFCHCVRREARRREPAVVCQQPFVVRRPKFRHRGRSRPRGRRDYRNQWRSHREHRRRLTRGPSPEELVSSATGRDHSSRQRHQSPTAASRLEQSRGVGCCIRWMVAARIDTTAWASKPARGAGCWQVSVDCSRAAGLRMRKRSHGGRRGRLRLDGSLRWSELVRRTADRWRRSRSAILRGVDRFTPWVPIP